MMPLIRTTTFAIAAGALALTAIAPEAEARPRRGAVAAGVAAGVVGGAIVGSLAARPYGYYGQPAYGYYGSPYGATTYSYAPGYAYGPGYYVPGRRFGPVHRGTTGLRAGTYRVSPHYNY